MRLTVLGCAGSFPGPESACSAYLVEADGFRLMLDFGTGSLSFGKDTKGKQRLVITEPDGTVHETLIPKEKHVLVHDGQIVQVDRTEKKRFNNSSGALMTLLPGIVA